MSTDTPRPEIPGASRTRSGQPHDRLLKLAGSLLAAAVLLPAAGCGLAGTAATATTGAAAEAQQAKQARALEDHVKQQVDAAVRANQQQLDAADKSAQ